MRNQGCGIERVGSYTEEVWGQTVHEGGFFDEERDIVAASSSLSRATFVEAQGVSGNDGGNFGAAARVHLSSEAITVLKDGAHSRQGVIEVSIPHQTSMIEQLKHLVDSQVGIESRVFEKQ